MNIDIASSGDTSCISIEDIDFTVTHVAGTNRKPRHHHHHQRQPRPNRPGHPRPPAEGVRAMNEIVGIGTVTKEQ